MNNLIALVGDDYVHFLLLLVAVVFLSWLGKCRPTRLAITLMALPVPLMLAGFFLPELTYAFNIYNPILIFAFLLDRFLLSVDPAMLAVRRVVADKISIGQENLVVVSVKNNSREALVGDLKDSTPAAFHLSKVPQRSVEQSFKLAAASQVAVRYMVRPLSRGEFTFGKVHLKYKSRLGLLWLVKKETPEEAGTVKVFPDLRTLRKMRVKYSRSQGSGELQKRRMGAEGTQFEGLRAYFTGDDVKKMDWKATARLDAPVVRTFTHEVEQPVLVLLDAGRKMQTHVKYLTKFDWALNAALSFAGVAIDRGDQVGVGVFSNREIVSPRFATGKKHLKRILDDLCDVQPEAIEPDYEEMMLQFSRALKRRSLVVIFTDLIDPMASRALIRSIRTFSKHHLLMIVTLSDTELIAAARQQPGDAYDAYKIGVTQDILEIRRKTLMELTRAHGAMVIDTPPDLMDESLINNYLAIKLKNKL